MITKEQIKEWDDQVREIGALLGMAFDEDYAEKAERGWAYWSQIKNGNKLISFHTSNYELQNRWQIRAEFPRDAKGQTQTAYNFKWPEITVAMSKPAEKIARDIKSRLLPEYGTALKDVLARIESSNKYSAGRMDQIGRVADFLGIPRPADEARMILYPERQRGIYRIEASADTAVKFEVVVNADRAIEILKLLGYGAEKV